MKDGLICVLCNRVGVFRARGGIPPAPNMGGGGRKAPGWWRQKRGNKGSKPQAYVLEDGTIEDDDGNKVGHASADLCANLDIDPPNAGGAPRVSPLEGRGAAPEQWPNAC